jgi:hypothetical protein
MRRFALPLLSAVLVALAAVVALSAATPPNPGATAPADEYFGKMKLSYLGINNSFKDASIMAGDHTVFAVVIHKIQLAEDAFLDWQHKYPSDPQLARSMFLMSNAYLKVWTADGQTRATYYLLELRDKYPHTFFGKQAKSSLSKGLTMHVYGAAPPCQPQVGEPTPTPEPMPSEDPKNNIHLQVEPAPCFTPAPTPPGQPIPVPTSGGAVTPGPLSTPNLGVTAAPTAKPAPGAKPTASPSPAPSATPPAGATLSTSAPATPSAPGTPSTTPAPSASPSPAHT